MPSKKKALEFLKESNNIESEYRDVALEDALKAWEYAMTLDELTINGILEVHRLLAQRMRPDIAGRFRNCGVWVGNHAGAPWELVPGLMNEWFTKHGSAKTEETIKKAHIEVERIHPHEDFNGRTYRLIMNFQRIKAGLPILVIRGWKEGENEHHPDQRSYYNWWN